MFEVKVTPQAAEDLLTENIRLKKPMKQNL